MTENNAVVQVVQSITAPEMQTRFKAMLPPDIKLDRFTEVVLTAIQANPDIINADKQTLYTACVSAAKRGLLPDKREGAFVTFNTKVADKWIKQVQFLPMVEGIIKEMGKAGIKAYAVSVYSNELPSFQIWNDDNGQHIKHVPIPFGDKGTRVGAFACGTTPDGRTYIEAMNMAELEKTALRSKQAKEKDGVKSRGGTWVTDPDRMEQKTVIHRLRRRMPMEGLFVDDDEIDVTPYQPSDIPSGMMSGGVQPAGDAENKRPRALQAVLLASNRSDPDQQMQPETERIPGEDDDVI